MTEIPDDMEQAVVVELTLPSARLLADQVSLVQDLRFVAACCDRLSEEGLEAGEVTAQALWSAALIGYARSFATGKRIARLTEADLLATGLEGEVVEFHRFVLGLRDKHVAHSVNPFEQVKVGAVLTNDSLPRAVQGVVMLSTRQVLGDDTAVRQLAGLAQAIIAVLNERAKEQCDLVLAETQGLDIDTLYALPPMRTYAPGAEQAVQPRT